MSRKRLSRKKRLQNSAVGKEKKEDGAGAGTVPGRKGGQEQQEIKKTGKEKARQRTVQVPVVSSCLRKRSKRRGIPKLKEENRYGCCIIHYGRGRENFQTAVHGRHKKHFVGDRGHYRGED